MEKAYIDLTPTWEQAINMHLIILQDGTDKGKRMAREELRKIGRQMDTLHKERKQILSEVEENFDHAWINLLVLYREACKRSGRDMAIDPDAIIERIGKNYPETDYSHVADDRWRNEDRQTTDEDY